jgi:hypothetical protein
LKEITYITDKFIKQNLETVPDVGSISMAGTRTRAGAGGDRYREVARLQPDH